MSRTSSRDQHVTRDERRQSFLCFKRNVLRLRLVPLHLANIFVGFLCAKHFMHSLRKGITSALYHLPAHDIICGIKSQRWYQRTDLPDPLFPVATDQQRSGKTCKMGRHHTDTRMGNLNVSARCVFERSGFCGYHSLYQHVSSTTTTLTSARYSTSGIISHVFFCHLIGVGTSISLHPTSHIILRGLTEPGPNWQSLAFL